MNSFDAFDFSTFATLVLVFVSIKVAVLALIVWARAKLFLVRDAVTHHQAATFLLASMLLMPALAFLVPAISFPLVLSVETAEATISDPVPTERQESAIRPSPQSAGKHEESLRRHFSAVYRFDRTGRSNCRRISAGLRIADQRPASRVSQKISER